MAQATPPKKKNVKIATAKPGVYEWDSGRFRSFYFVREDKTACLAYDTYIDVWNVNVVIYPTDQVPNIWIGSKCDEMVVPRQLSQLQAVLNEGLLNYFQ